MAPPSLEKRKAALPGTASPKLESLSGVSNADNTERKATRQLRWQAQNPLARWCHIATASAVRKGLIKVGPCEVCGSTENVDLHHDRHDRPLETISLCRRHHRQHHARLRKAGVA